MLLKCCTQYVSKATGLESVSFHFNPKECSNYGTIVLMSHASKIMLKVTQLLWQVVAYQLFHALT